MNLWGNILPQNGACNHFFHGRLGEIGTKVHFCCITDSELAQRLAWATSITRPTASAPAWRGHQEQIETAFSTRVLNGSEDDRTVNNSYQESPRFHLFMVRQALRGATNTMRLFAHTVKRWVKAGGGELKTMLRNDKNMHNLNVETFQFHYFNIKTLNSKIALCTIQPVEGVVVPFLHSKNPTTTLILHSSHFFLHI